MVHSEFRYWQIGLKAFTITEDVSNVCRLMMCHVRVEKSPLAQNLLHEFHVSAFCVHLTSLVYIGGRKVD